MLNTKSIWSSFEPKIKVAATFRYVS